MNKIRKKIGTRAFVITLIALFCLICSGVFWSMSKNMSDSLYDQQAARFWMNGNSEFNYAQVSAFFATGTGFGIEQVMQFRDKLEAKMEENSITVTGSARYWVDAFSTTNSLSVSNEDNVSTNVLATGVGGDFFFFHPLEMLSGQTLNPNDVTKDIILLDWDVAWRLFGSFDVVDAPVTINSKTYYVGGVFKKEVGWPGKLTYGETGRIYMSYEAMENIFGNNVEISTLEIVAPNMVSGIAKSMMEDCISIDDTQRFIVDNSARFNTLNMLREIKNITANLMQTKAIALPHWENAARVAEVYAQVFLLLSLSFLVFPIISFVMLIVAGYKRLGKLKDWIVNKSDEMRRRRRDKNKQSPPDSSGDSGETPETEGAVAPAQSTATT